MPSGISVRNALICDVIYQDEGTGKAILAGVYTGDILLSNIPTDLRVSFYVEIHPDDEEPRDLDLGFYLNGKKLGGFKADQMSSPKNLPIIFATPAVALKVVQPGNCELRLTVNGGRSIKVLKKLIGQKLSPVATVSPPPS